MPVIARDAVASDHLVYAWPFPIGPDELEVSCSDDEQVVMCPSWIVGDRLGPGRHRWRTPDPTRPVAAYFVLTAPVEVSYDMVTSFTIPATGHPVRLRATGSLQVRCGDPALLIAQFVGLPFDHVNDGILRSVSRSIERMLARLLTRRVVMAGTPHAVTDPSMLSGIMEELVAYNPAAGAVFGVELIRMGHLQIYADDGSNMWSQMQPPQHRTNGDTARGMQSPRPDIPLLETVRAVPTSRAEIPLLETVRTPVVPPPVTPPMPPPIPPAAKRGNPVVTASGEIGGNRGNPIATASGEIGVKRLHKTSEPPPPGRVITTPVPPVPRVAASVEVARPPIDVDDVTEPDMSPIRNQQPRAGSEPPGPQEPRGSILGIGMSHIGSAGVASGEISKSKIAPGARVLVPGPNGLMQSATVRQLLQGYYELEVGSSGETIWVPINGVVPEH